MDKRVGGIKRSIDYSMFKLTIHNREISPRKIRTLRASIEKDNFLELFPIVVNDKMEIMDGQHRFMVAQALQIPIFYIIGKSITGLDVAEINTQQTPWSIRDYLDYFVRQGLTDYITFNGFMETYGFPHSAVMILLCGSRDKKKSLEFKSGRMVVSESTEQAHSVAKHVLDFADFDCDFVRSRSFIFAVFDVMCHPDYSHKKMMKKMDFLAPKLQRSPDKETYLRLLEDIYNYNQHKKVRFF